MKKLIAISVIFALVAGAAFAEATLGGQLMIGTTFLTAQTEGDDEQKAAKMGGMQYHEAKMSAVFGDSKGGGKLVFTVGNDGAYSGGLGNAWKTAWGFLYWRPVPQFRMQVGVNADGDFGAAMISGWGFTGEAKNSVAAWSDYADWGGSNTGTPLWIFQSALTRNGNAFYPGTGDLANVNFQFFPIDGLTITFVLPIGSGVNFSGDGASGLQVGDQLSDFHLNVKYAFEEIGNLNLSFVGRGGLGSSVNAAGDEVKRDKSHSVGNLYASFYLTAIDKIKLDLGLVYNIPYKNDADQDLGGFLGVGLGLLFDTGEAFTLKFRVNARLGGYQDSTGGNRTGTVQMGEDNITLVYANILPCYKINNNVWFFFYAGIGLESHADWDDQIISWFVNPYIWVRASEGLRFWTGLQLVQKDVYPDNEKNPVLWRVPFGFNFYF